MSSNCANKGRLKVGCLTQTPYNWWNEDVIRCSRGDQRNFDLRAVFIFSDRHGGAAQREFSLARQTSTAGFTVAALLVGLGVITFLFPSAKGRAKASTRSVVRHLRERPCRKAQLDLSGRGGDPSRSPPLHRSEQPKLFLRCVIKLFVRVHHVLMGLLDGVEFLLLLRGKQRPNLRRTAVDHSFHFLHRLLMNGGYLRFGRVENRLNLCLLIGGQVQVLG